MAGVQHHQTDAVLFNQLAGERLAADGLGEFGAGRLECQHAHSASLVEGGVTDVMEDLIADSAAQLALQGDELGIVDALQLQQAALAQIGGCLLQALPFRLDVESGLIFRAADQHQHAQRQADLDDRADVDQARVADDGRLAREGEVIAGGVAQQLPRQIGERLGFIEVQAHAQAALAGLGAAGQVGGVNLTAEEQVEELLTESARSAGGLAARHARPAIEDADDALGFGGRDRIGHIHGDRADGRVRQRHAQLPIRERLNAQFKV